MSIQSIPRFEKPTTIYIKQQNLKATPDFLSIPKTTDIQKKTEGFSDFHGV